MRAKKLINPDIKSLNHIRIHSYGLRSPPIFTNLLAVFISPLSRERLLFSCDQIDITTMEPSFGSTSCLIERFKCIVSTRRFLLKNPDNRSLSSPHWSDTRALHPRILYYGASGISCSPHLLLYQTKLASC